MSNITADLALFHCLWPPLQNLLNHCQTNIINCKKKVNWKQNQLYKSLATNIKSAFHWWELLANPRVEKLVRYHSNTAQQRQKSNNNPRYFGTKTVIHKSIRYLSIALRP